MATRIRYIGPEGQVSFDVGLATGESSELEPGKVYELPAELAESLRASSSHWEGVRNLDDLPAAELKRLAAEAEIEGRGSMKKDELVAALREHASRASTSATDTTNTEGVSDEE